MTVAETILQQLGGNRFCAMPGAKNFVGGDDRLQFAIPLRRDFYGRSINRVTIVLDPSDIYIVKTGLYERSKFEYRDVACTFPVYVDALRAVFTAMTGLETSL